MIDIGARFLYQNATSIGGVVKHQEVAIKGPRQNDSNENLHSDPCWIVPSIKLDSGFLT
jgi:hypothetical protein